jgi:hypothetical protein
MFRCCWSLLGEEDCSLTEAQEGSSERAAAMASYLHVIVHVIWTQ